MLEELIEGIMLITVMLLFITISIILGTLVYEILITGANPFLS